ncbi:MAG: hypothetical protein J0H01_17955 [Rhizobiales bacterium]|nr:hypothetical protein [Hyphomicrobiales bacterium]
MSGSGVPRIAQARHGRPRPAAAGAVTAISGAAGPIRSRSSRTIFSGLSCFTAAAPILVAAALVFRWWWRVPADGLFAISRFAKTPMIETSR